MPKKAKKAKATKAKAPQTKRSTTTTKAGKAAKPPKTAAVPAVTEADIGFSGRQPDEEERRRLIPIGVELLTFVRKYDPTAWLDVWYGENEFRIELQSPAVRDTVWAAFAASDSPAIMPWQTLRSFTANCRARQSFRVVLMAPEAARVCM